MFVWFWFPNYIFTALSAFSWITWIAPKNVNLTTITGFNTGLGVNPFPTFDWNVLLFDNQDPFMVPFFNTVNNCLHKVRKYLRHCPSPPHHLDPSRWVLDATRLVRR